MGGFNQYRSIFCFKIKRIHSAILCMGILSLLMTNPVFALTLTVDGSQKHQTIDGFGTNINSLSWTNENSKAAIDLLADQMGQTLWRVVFDMEDWESTNDNSDPSTPNWTYYNSLYSNAKFQNLWGTLRYLNQKGFNKTIALSFMGRVPGWMGTTTINTSQEDEAVEMIATLLYYARNTENVQFSMLDPFNESDWDGIEGPQLPAQQYVRLLHKLSVKLDAMGLSDIRFIGPNTANISNGVNTYMPAMMADTTVMSKVDHFGFHSYSADSGNANTSIKNSAYPNKNLWMTEYANPADAFSFLGQNASAMIVWEGFDSVYNHAILAGRGSLPANDDVGYVPLSYNANTHSYTPRKEFYRNAQLFKFIPPESIRIGTTGSTGGLTCYAFYHAASNRLTIVAQNTGASVSVTGSLLNLPAISNFSSYKTDASNSMSRDSDVPVTSNNFSFVVPSGGIVTLTSILDAGSPLLPPSNLTTVP
jgi:O-glycosyl hydrolase